MNKKGKIIMYGSVYACLFIMFSLFWAIQTFSLQSLNQIIYHMKFQSSQFDVGIVYDFLIKVVPLTILVSFLVTKVLSYLVKKKERVFHKYSPILCVLTIVMTLTITCLKLNVVAYFVHKSETSSFYQKNYVDPKSVQMSFNGEKHNLIHIYLESVETTYLSKKNGGQFDTSLMSQLEGLALDNIHFSHNSQLGGALTLEGTQWTTASVIAQTSGITSSLSLDEKVYEKDSEFLPGVYSLGEFLSENGYHQEVIMGSNADFAGISNYYKQHGNYKIMDYNQALQDGKIPEDYHVFWGYEDQKLFSIAKDEITHLAHQDGHFSVEIMTIDTHTPYGYICDKCPQTYDNQYKNVIACQSQQVYEFVKWIQQQDFYKDTTIVITGDHKSMASQFFDQYCDTDYIRTPYNCFINSVVDTSNTKNRSFNVVDMYPTILASIGVDIDGEKLGLGTNLFSNEETLLEKYSLEYINNELSKTDLFYQNELLQSQKKNKDFYK